MKVLFLGIILGFCGFAWATDTGRPKVEDDYNREFCDEIGGESEHSLLDGKFRVDCLLPNRSAIEMDWAKKYAECIGQAVLYGAITGLRPGCMLIIRYKKDCHYADKMRYASAVIAMRYGLSIGGGMVGKPELCDKPSKKGQEI